MMTDADWEYLKKRWQEAKNAILTDDMRPQFEEMVRKGEIKMTHIYRGVITDYIQDA